jgi:hypothetical protein
MEPYIAGTSLAYIKIEELKLIGLSYTLLPGSLASKFANLHVSQVKLTFHVFFTPLLLRCLMIFHRWGRKGQPRYPLLLKTLVPQQRNHLATEKRKSRSALFIPCIPVFFCFGCSFLSALSHFNHRNFWWGKYHVLQESGRRQNAAAR